MPERIAIPLGQKRWLKVITLLLFMVPAIVERNFDYAQTTAIITAVLAHPWINDLGAVLVIAKYLLAAVAIVGLAHPALIGRLGWGYYAVILVVVAFGQNIGVTERFGAAWLIGCTVVQLSVAGCVAADVLGGRSNVRPEHLQRHRMWVLVPMLLAWWFPHVVREGVPRIGLPAAALWNEAGVTYCMITPVVLGLMILFSDGVYAPTLAIASWVGALFGVSNAIVWFVANRGGWWMGVLHLPLLVLSVYGIWLSRRKRLRL